MGIPISEYVDVTTKVIAPSIPASPDYNGLVFVDSDTKTTVDAVVASKKALYDGGDVVQVSLEEMALMFDGTEAVSIFAGKYFGYSNGGQAPKFLNIVKIGGTETAKAAYDRVMAKFNNFGAFAFVCPGMAIGTSSSGGLLDVATANASTGHQFCVAVTSTEVDAASSALFGIEGTHLVVSDESDMGTSGDATDDINFGTWMPISWYAAVNYQMSNASSSIDYKTFGGEVATCTSLTTKTSWDAKRANYIGQVQVYGTETKFYQRGKNMDGMDIGVFRDKNWIKAMIEIGWFGLNINSNIPANLSGMNSVYTMIHDVATSAVGNGCILVDKPLTALQESEILRVAGDKAIDDVSTNGFYITTKLIFADDKYQCQYVLVYAKGDHIEKLVGTHYLV